MKTRIQIIGVLISFSWFVTYVGGGAFLFAHKAVSNPDHVPVYMPLLIFTWIIGFFFGHALLSYVFRKLTATKSPN